MIPALLAAEARFILNELDRLADAWIEIREIAARNPIIWPFLPVVLFLLLVAYLVLRHEGRRLIRELEMYRGRP